MKTLFTTRVLLALLVTVVFWASAFAGIRVGLQGYPPAHLAILRFVIASVVLGIYAALSHFRLPQRRDLPGIAAASFLGITFYNIALNYGETKVPAGTASLLIASTPIWTALFASLALKERLRIWGWVGILLSFIGAGIIGLSEGHGVHFSKHALIIMAASCCSAIYIVMQKHYLSRYSALEFTAYSIWMGTLLMLPFRSRHVSFPGYGTAAEHLGSRLSRHIPRRHGLLSVGLRSLARPGFAYGKPALPHSRLRNFHRLDLASRDSGTAVPARRSPSLGGSSRSQPHGPKRWSPGRDGCS